MSAASAALSRHLIRLSASCQEHLIVITQSDKPCCCLIIAVLMAPIAHKRGPVQLL
jgi:hypothetical protein